MRKEQDICWMAEGSHALSFLLDWACKNVALASCGSHLGTVKREAVGEWCQHPKSRGEAWIQVTWVFLDPTMPEASLLRVCGTQEI